MSSISILLAVRPTRGELLAQTLYLLFAIMFCPLLLCFVFVYWYTCYNRKSLQASEEERLERAGLELVKEYQEFDMEIEESIELFKDLNRSDTIGLMCCRRAVAMSLATYCRAKLGLKLSAANALVARQIIFQMLREDDPKRGEKLKVRIKDARIIVTEAMAFVFIQEPSLFGLDSSAYHLSLDRGTNL